WVVVEAVRTWAEPTPRPDWYTLLIAGASVVANEIIFRYSATVADRTGSKSIKASAWDQRLDVFVSLIVLGSLAVTIWAAPDWHFIDHLAAVIVGITICIAGASICWGSMQDLMDRQAEPEMLAKIRQIALEVRCVKGIEKLLVRKAGLEHLVDI